MDLGKTRDTCFLRRTCHGTEGETLSRAGGSCYLASLVTDLKTCWYDLFHAELGSLVDALENPTTRHYFRTS
jgi:hypothetical protein